MEDELNLDTFVSSWLQAQMMAKMAVGHKIMEAGPPNPESAAKMIKLMTEISLLESLEAQVSAGTLSQGARVFGMDSVPVSDKCPDALKGVSEESLQQAIADIEKLLGEDMTEVGNKLREMGIVNDSNEAEPAEETKTPEFTWSF